MSTAVPVETRGRVPNVAPNPVRVNEGTLRPRPMLALGTGLIARPDADQSARPWPFISLSTARIYRSSRYYQRPESHPRLLCLLPP